MAREFAKAFYNSKEWQRVREYCLLRDHHGCVKCGAPAEEVHHIIHLSSDNINDVSISLNPDNLICLCKNCHFDIHRQDKIDGINKSKGIEVNPYEFDEFGQLVRRKDLSPH